MALAVSDWSNTASGNTAIDGTNIDENCSPGGLNNAIRAMMAAIKDMYDDLPSSSSFVTKAAGVFSGTQPTYTGRGAYLHHNSSSLTSGRIFMQASGGSTPSGMLPGDILLEY